MLVPLGGGKPYHHDLNMVRYSIVYDRLNLLTS